VSGHGTHTLCHSPHRVLCNGFSKHDDVWADEVLRLLRKLCPPPPHLHPCCPWCSPPLSFFQRLPKPQEAPSRPLPPAPSSSSSTNTIARRQQGSFRTVVPGSQDGSAWGSASGPPAQPSTPQSVLPTLGRSLYSPVRNSSGTGTPWRGTAGAHCLELTWEHWEEQATESLRVCPNASNVPQS
jgi:hypothetical protein